MFILNINYIQKLNLYDKYILFSQNAVINIKIVK